MDSIPTRPQDAESTRLHIFISYATEDEHLADNINDALRDTFGPGIIKTTIASEIAPGDEWRERLEGALDDADILLIVATGRQKLSHSFSGSEVGFFRGSRLHRPKMRNFDSERLIVPIAIFTKIPETVTDIQSIQFEGPLAPVSLDPAFLKNEEAFLQQMALDENDIFSRLFDRILGIVRHSSIFRFTDDEIRSIERRKTSASRKLHSIIFSELRNRISTEIFPEKKIVMRLSATRAGISGDDHILDDAKIAFFGRPFEVLGFAFETTAQSPFIPFDDFVGSIKLTQSRFASALTEALKWLLVAAKSNDFGENRRLITSPDGTRFFRLFVARDVLYYSGTNEIHIYMVEVRSRDYGDPTTSMLLKAITIGLQYRFMFLEDKSEFSPNAIKLTVISDFKSKVSRLIQELDYLLWASKDAGLNDSIKLLMIYGESLPDNFDEQVALWEARKEELSKSSFQVLEAADDHLIALKSEFIKELSCFCSATAKMNSDFTARILRVLEQIVEGKKLFSTI